MIVTRLAKKYRWHFWRVQVTIAFNFFSKSWYREYGSEPTEQGSNV
jgi:hypothetical protein